MNSMECKCKSPDRWIGSIENTFTDLTLLDWYDGFVTAVCRCRICSSPYLISIIAWKPSASLVRVYGVSSITVKSFDEIRRLLYHDQQPSVKAFAALTPVEGFEKATSLLLANAEMPHAVLASADLENEVIAARKMINAGIPLSDPYGDDSEVDFDRWLMFLHVQCKAKGATS